MFTTRREFLGATAAGAAILATGCTPSTPAAGGASDTKLNKVLDRFSVQTLHDSPEYATSLAVPEDKAGGRYIDRLSDLSKEGKAKQLDLAKKGLADIQAISRDSLSKEAKVTYDVVVTAVEN